MFSFTLRYVHLCLCIKLRWKICTFLYVCVYGHVWIFSVYKPSCSSVPDYCWDYFYSVYIVSHTAFASVFLNARLSLVLEIHARTRARAHVHNTQMLPNPKELRSWNYCFCSIFFCTRTKEIANLSAISNLNLYQIYKKVMIFSNRLQWNFVFFCITIVHFQNPW